MRLRRSYLPPRDLLQVSGPPHYWYRASRSYSGRCRIAAKPGTPSSRITSDTNDGEFAGREFFSSPADQRYVCACCGRPVAVREPVRWRVHLRRGWVR